MTPRFRRWLTLPDGIALLILAGCLVAFSVTVPARDFLSYWAAGQQLIHHANPYGLAAIQQIQHNAGWGGRTVVLLMRNPPTALPLALPLGLLGYKTGSLLWSLLLLACFAASIVLVRSLHGYPGDHLHVIAYTFGPAIACLLTGQIPLLALLGLAFFLRFHRAYPLLAGANLWLCLLKPHLFLPFGVVLLAWIILTRGYRIAIGAIGSLLLGLVIVFPFDPAAWSQYHVMMQSSGLIDEFIPCWSVVFRRAIDLHAMWLQFLPAALACLWALWFFRKHRHHWDWNHHGALLMIVSVLVAPYAWLIDQSVLIPALLHALYRSRSRASAIALASVGILILIQIFLGAGTHSRWNLWPAPFWLAWYLFTVRSGAPQPASPEPALSATHSA